MTIDGDASIPTGKARGGFARAEVLSPEQRRQIARRAAAARWGKSLPQATHKGVLKIGDKELLCFVLDDGRRVISGRGMTAVIGMKGRGQGTARIASLIRKKSSDNNDLALAIESPLVFDSGAPLPTQGYEAPMLVQLCEAILDARDAGLLRTDEEQRYGVACYILTRAFAKVGIIALVDEATGYQEVRDRLALQQILDRYIGKELAKWASTFKQEFYEQIFRLKSWTFDRSSTRRPLLMANLTIDLVYRRLAPGVLAKLQELSPKDEHGRRKNKLFQWLSPMAGHPALDEHLSNVTFLAKAHDDWDSFYRALDRVAPKFGDTLPLPFSDEETSAGS